MIDISQVTFCLVDNGLFLPLATCLAEKAKRVILWSPDCRPFPSVKQACIGMGFDNVERVQHFWPMLDEISCFVFPDISQGPLQKHLVEIGKPVWGSRNGDTFEINREKFMDTLGKVGMEVPKYQAVKGWSNLRQHLRQFEDKYIKISRFRADLETTHWRSWALDEPWLDWLAVNFGPLKEEITFLVFDAIDTELEIGADTYCVDGQWPELMLNGIEGKDKCYLSKVTERKEMPEPIIDMLDAWAPVLKKHNYRNQFSSELRIKDDKAYFIDFTGRGGMPSSGSQQLVWKNFPEIIWSGSNGELVQPEPAAQYTIECMITSKTGKDLWDTVEISEDLLPWVRFSECCKVNDRYCFPPNEFHGGDLGWLVALGDTPSKVFDRIKELADMLPDGLNADVEALASIIQEVETAEEEGVEFTRDKMPEPAIVLEK